MYREGQALAALDRIDDALAVAREITARDRSFDVFSGGNALRQLGLELRVHGNREAARQVLSMASEWFDGYPEDGAGALQVRYERALTAYDSEHWETAYEGFRALAAEYPDSVRYRGWVGITLARLGRRAEAEEMSASLLEFDHPFVLIKGLPFELQARIAVVLGDREQATKLFRRAIESGLPYHRSTSRGGLWFHHDIDVEHLRDYPPYQELVRPKG